MNPGYAVSSDDWRPRSEVFDRLPTLAAELAQLLVDALVAGSPHAIRATMQATHPVPTEVKVVVARCALGSCLRLGDQRLERTSEGNAAMMRDRRPSGFRPVTGAVGLLLLVALLASCLHTQDATAAKQRKRPLCAKSIPAILARVSPAVVFITATSINLSQLTDRVIQVVGSEFFFDSSGLILTNSPERASLRASLGRRSSTPRRLAASPARGANSYACAPGAGSSSPTKGCGVGVGCDDPATSLRWRGCCL